MLPCARRADILALVCAQPVPPPPVQFDRITLEDAKRLEGTELRVIFTPDQWATAIVIDGVQHTHAGPEEFDEHGRTVILKGDRTAKLRAGKPVTIRGVLRIVRHPDTVTNGVVVPAWCDIRVEQR